MNQLSWMLYLAGVSGNLQGTFIFLCIVSGVGLAVNAMFYFCTLDSYQQDEHAITVRVLKWLLPTWVAFCLLAALIPSERTFYFIAASEMGEQAIKTQTGQKAVAAVNRYLDSIGIEEPEKKQDK
jgi:hypothetical protein